jgi:hypothetical protein
MTSHQPNDTRLGGFNTASTKLLEDLFLALDLEPVDENERMQSLRDSWFTNLTPQHA